MLFANYCKACKELIFFVLEEFFSSLYTIGGQRPQGDQRGHRSFPKKGSHRTWHDVTQGDRHGVMLFGMLHNLKLP